MSVLGKILSFISAIGAINWGLFAVFQFDLVKYTSNMIGRPMLGKYIYIFIAFAGLFTILALFRD